MADASALTMGRARGAVLIGRPLNLSIPVAIDEGEGACFDSELYFGETRVEKPTLQWEPGRDAQGQVRLVTRQAVDEPMVTVYLTAGCRNRITRRYVMLSEQPPDSEPAPRAPGISTVTTPAVATPAARPVAIAPPPAVVGGARAPASASAPQPVAPPRPRASPAPTREARATVRARPRLMLEAPDLESDGRLRLDTGLRSEPTTDARTRQQAAALWRALNTPPEQAVREADRLRALESDVAALKDSSRQTAVALTLMVEQLEKARRERNQVAMILLVFAGLVVLGVSAGGSWWWFRRRSADPARPWHLGPAESREQARDDIDDHPHPRKRPARTEAPAAESRPDAVPLAVPAPETVRPRGDETVDALRERPVAERDSPPVPLDPPDTSDRLEELTPVDFAPSLGSSRVVGVEELMDVEDKAAFFVSIGQHDQAMAVLESHVHDEVETSALPWLDLLELYHTFDRRDDYQRLRQEFIGQFNAEVPEFDAFAGACGGLQDYPRALTRIVSLWPTPKVLEVIEESIFRKPDAPGAEAFSLEAYRELLLLYHLAREVIPRQAEVRPFRSTDFTSTSLEPLSARMQRGGDQPSGVMPLIGDRPPPLLQLADLDIPDLDIPDLDMPDLDKPGLDKPGLEIPQVQIPPASPRLGLDVDLAEIEGEAHSQTVLAPDLEFHLEWDPPALTLDDGPDRGAKP